MTRQEAIKIMEILYSFYSNFNRKNMDNFNHIWLAKLEEGDYEKTLKKTNEYVDQSPYPPSPADIIVKPYIHRDDGMPEKIREAEERVKREEESDPGAKERRRRKLDELRRKLGEYYGE